MVFNKCLVARPIQEVNSLIKKFNLRIEELNSFMFTTQAHLDELLICALTLETLRYERDFCKIFYLMDYEVDSRYKVKTSAELSIFFSENKFNILDNEHHYDSELIECLEDSDFNIYNKVINIRPRILYDDYNNYQFSKDFFRVPYIRNKILSIRLNNVIKMFSFNRASKYKIPYLEFCLYSNLELQDVFFKKPYTYSSIVGIFRYVRNGIISRLPKIEDNIEMQDLEDPEIFDVDDITTCYLKRKVENQMDKESPHGDCDDLDVVKQQNTMLTTHAESSTAEPIPIERDLWESLCSSQNVQEYTQLMSRYQRYRTYSWSQSKRNGEEIATINLFKDLIDEFKDSPSCMLFKLYAYFKSDLEIRIQCNSNRFMNGSLMGYVYYGYAMDLNAKDRDNIYSASQLSHCIIDAANSPDGAIIIPYKHYKPLMAINTRMDDKNVLDMARFRIVVLNKLKSLSTDTSPCDITVYFRFINPSFHGMKPYIENQMNGVLNIIDDTSKLLRNVFPDRNRDNPTDPRPANTMVPSASHSWSFGDSISEPLNSLRLQATGVTPHYANTNMQIDEMSLDYVKSIYGLIDQLLWKVGTPSGTILKKIPFSPVLASYPKTTLQNYSKDAYECDVMPPVSVLANLFAYWRGSLEYKLDFISTFAHTGRLIIAYLPRVVLNRDPSLTQLTACDHIIVDLRDEKQIIYTCSFLSDKPWWPRRSNAKSSTEIYPPGYIYIAILNELTATQAVSMEVEINLYLRGGTDFELHVPSTPHIGLSYNTEVVTRNAEFISYLDGYGPPAAGLYIGSWHSVTGAILRYSPVSDHVTQFDIKLASRRKVYVQTNPTSFPQYKYNEKLTDFKYIVLFALGGYCYGAPFPIITLANQFALSLNDKGEMSGNSKLIPLSEDGPYAATTKFSWRENITVEGFEIIAQAGDERLENCGTNVSLHSDIKTTQNGMITFGEKITDLRQLARRYQPYSQNVFTSSKKSNPSKADLAIPILPQGLDLQPTNKDRREDIYVNRTRDGPIPIIASGYRFFRGSIRMRLVVVGKTEGLIWVQHRPEVAYSSAKSYIPHDNEIESYYNPGYAYHIQLTKINNIIELEIPFYLPGQYGMLQRPNLDAKEDAPHYSLGTLYIGFDTFTSSVADTPMVIQSFYSIADDMSFSVFQGFPPMIDTSIFLVTAQGPLSFLRDKITGQLTSVAVDVIEQTKEKLSETYDTEDGVADSVDKLLSTYAPELSSEKKHVLLSMFTNLIHSLINPSISTIAWSFASILVGMGLVAWKYVDKLGNCLKKLLNWFSFKKPEPNTNSSNKSDQERIESQADGDHPEAAFVSTCVAGMLALIQASDKPLPKSMPNFAAYLYAGMPKFTYTANGLFTFLKNNLVMFKNIWYWLVAKFNKDYILYTELANASSDVVMFIKKIQWCLDPRNEETIMNNVTKTATVYKLANIAQSYAAKRAVSNVQKNMPLFDNYCKKIVDFRDTLTRKMKSPPIRFEPFVISLVGPSNIGKSHMAQRIARELLHSIDYKTYGELVYVRNPGNAYWNTLKNQPVVLYDDFLNITDPNYALISVSEMYCLKSKAVFNPPMAAVEEKDLRYNPLLVILLQNEAYPKIAGLGCEEAFYRRRDTMWHVNKKIDFKGIHPRSMTNEQKSTYAHLEFSPYLDPSGKSSEGRKYEKKMKPYEEFLPALMTEFQEYFHEEVEQYNNAIDELANFYPEEDELSEEYIKRCEDKVNEINNTRVTQQELELVNESMLKIRKQLFTDDMTKYLQTKIKDKKMKEFAEEVKSQENDVVKMGMLQKLKMLYDKLNSVIDPEVTNKIAEQIRIITSDYKKKFPHEDDIHSLKITASPINILENQMNLSVSACLTMNGAEEEYENIRSVVDSDDKRIKYIDLLKKFGITELANEQTCDTLEDSIAEIIQEAKLEYKENKEGAVLMSIYSNKIYDEYINCFKIRPSCFCVVKLIYMRKYLSIDDNYDVRYSVKHRSFQSRLFCDHDNCYINNKQFLEKTYEIWSARMNEVPLMKYPSQLLTIKNIKEASNSNIGTMPTTMVSAMIEKEVDDKAWYKKIFESLPKWGSILTWILNLICIFGVLGTFFGIANWAKNKALDIEVDNKAHVYQNKYYDNNIKAEELLDATLSKQWMEIKDDLRIVPMEEAGNYKLGSLGAKVNKAVPVKALAQSCEQQENVITKLIMKNTFWILAEYVEHGIIKTKILRCLGLYKHYFLLLDHYIGALRMMDDLKLSFIKQGTYITIPNSVVFTNIKKLQNSALCIGTMYKTIPMFSNIIKFIIKAGDTKNICPQAKLYEYSVEGESYVMKVQSFARIMRKDQVDVSNDDNTVTHVSSLYAYPYAHRGVCGSVLVSTSNMNAPILGIHIAGFSNGVEGFAEAITYETFAFLENLDETSVIVEENGLNEYISEKQNPLLNLDGNIFHLGVVKPKYAYRVPAKSRLEYTECANKITKVTYDYPVLTNKDERIKDNPFSPILEGCKHHTNPCRDMNPLYLDRAVEDVTHMIMTNVMPQRLNVGKLTVEEAVCGVKNNPAYESMVMNTSEGFPWSVKRPKGFVDKSWMFERVLEDNFWRLIGIDDELEGKILSNNWNREHGIAIQTVFTDCLKDAKLPKEKVLLPGKTRIFSISPVDFTVSVRQYLLDFVVAYMAGRIDSEHAVGIDIYSYETNVLINKLLEYGNNMVCGDYSKFGDQLYGICVHRVYKIIAKWYIHYGAPEYYRTVTECFAYETANAIHLMCDLLYQCIGGMPSGNPLTVVINSIVNSMYVRIIWQYIMMEGRYYDLVSMASFNENVLVITFGDDLFMSVKDQVKEIYNACSMSREFIKLNIKFTNSTKKDTMIPYASVLDENVTFLKCTFALHDTRANVWVARMEKRVIEETCNWCWNTNKDNRSNSIEACKAMMELAYSGGRDYYNRLRDRVYEYWENKHVNIHIMDWESIDIRIYDM
uniref:Genome polyprotein n=1 Tax=Serbia picorna-like virus 2 TaxID=2771462 RepID=A0A7H1C902_9VIRU|nr:RNA-dependent RNA polymerase [Serbia picorna-like virus 2]